MGGSEMSTNFFFEGWHFSTDILVSCVVKCLTSYKYLFSSNYLKNCILPGNHLLFLYRDYTLPTKITDTQIIM